MFPIHRLVEQLRLQESCDSCDRPGKPEDFDDTSKELMQRVAKPAGPEIGKGPGKDAVPGNAMSSSADGPKWSTAFKKGTPMSQEKGTGSAPPTTVDGPVKKDPDTFLK